MGKMKYFPAYLTYRQTLAGLTDEQVGKLFRAALDYADEGIVPDLGPLCTLAFGFIKWDIDRMNEQYFQKCEQLRENGMKGGRPPKNTEEPDAFPENQKKPNGFSENQMEPDGFSNNHLEPDVTQKTKGKGERNGERDGNGDGYGDGKGDGDGDGENITAANAAVNNTPTKKPSQNLPDDFVEFWSAYPKKKGKQNALKAWKKIKPDEELFHRIITAVESQKHSRQWTADGGQYIPEPASWLNGGRWDDECDLAISASEERDPLLEFCDRVINGEA